MALGRFDGALHHRKGADARRHQTFRARDQHGDVEMIGQELAGLDRALIAAIDQRDAFAFETDEGNFGQRLGGNRKQRRHLRPGLGGVGRPAGGLAHVGERQRAGALARDFGEQRRLLRAADNDVVAGLAAARKRSISARQSWFAVFSSAPRQPRASASASSGMVSSQEHTRMVRFSAILAPALKVAAMPAHRDTR